MYSLLLMFWTNQLKVADEADRLLSQSFQEWLKQVLSSIHPHPIDSFPNQPSAKTWEEDAIAPAWSGYLTRGAETDFDETKHHSCQKLLFSATLTSDPSKLSGLELRNPKYFVVKSMAEEITYGDEFETPSTLKVCVSRSF